MISLHGRYITTESDIESENLLKMAVAQNFKLPRGEKAMESGRCFYFNHAPYCDVLEVDKDKYDVRADRYSDLFGNAVEQARKIADDAAKWCRAFGYTQLNVFAGETTDGYSGKCNAKTESGKAFSVAGSKIPRPVRMTVDEISSVLGYPVEIIA